MEPSADRQAPPVFSPQVLMDLYLRGRHAELSENFLSILRHFRETTYQKLDPQGRFFVNEFVKHFLTLFTQDDYQPAPIVEFVRLNPTVANLVALSSFGTTDPFLELLRDRPDALGKVLTLYSARNAVLLDRQSFFDADPILANVWYGAFAELCQSGLVRGDVLGRLRDHFNAAGDRSDARYAALDSYFASTYVDGRCDRVVKSAINRSLRTAALANNVRVRNRADPRQIAVLSGNWSPEHSVYRISRASVAALKGYHLTLFHFGRKRTPDLSLFDASHRLDFDSEGTLDLGPLLDNEFSVAYYPDVGLTPQSVWLANLRIAPIQVASLGHSVSTWGADIDYFLSGAAVEPADDPGRNYSERLVLLPGSGAVHERPDYTPTGRRKADAGILINAPWNAQKVNHGFALTLRELVNRSRRDLRIRLFASASLNRRNDYLPFVRDLEALLGPDRVEVFPALPYREYMAMMEEGDLTLDSSHFGGCNTVADSLFLRKPTVTWEGDAWYNRIGSQMVRAAGLPELAATTSAEYLDVSLRLIHDDAFRASIQQRLDRADLDATVFSTAEARYFPQAISYLIENHDRLSQERDRSPIWIDGDPPAA